MSNHPQSRKEVLARLDKGGFDVTVLNEVTFPHRRATNIRVTMDRFDSVDADGNPEPAEYEVLFRERRDYVTLHPEQIPALIDALTEMHRYWLLDLNGS